MEDAVTGRTPRGTLRRFRDPAAVARAAAEEFALAVERAVDVHGTTSVVLSGGSTPRRLYERLASAPYRNRVPWRDIEFFWGDERSVPSDHPDSNFRMAYEALLGAVASPMQLHRMEAERDDLDAAARDYEGEIRDILGMPAGGVPRGGPPGGAPPRFDLVLLGLGTDGHTLSLFPGSPALEETSRLVVPAPGPVPGTQRMTLTLPIVNRARRVLFLVTGRDKAEMLRRVHIEGDESLPASHVHPGDGELLWLVDDAAWAG